MNIEEYGRNALVEHEDVVFSYEVSENPRDLEQSRITKGEETLDWTNANRQYTIDNWRILPYGDNNDLPTVIRDAVANNSKVPGVIKKKTGMLWGKGPKLYKENFDDNFQLRREWTHDAEIEDWLESWDCNDYLHKGCVDYNHIEGTFSKFYLNRGARINGKKKISKLEHISPDKSRLATRSTNQIIKPDHVIINDWNLNHVDHLTNFKVYPLFDLRAPFAYKNSIFYSNMYSFCSDYYTVPDIYGSLEWIRRSTAVPLILKALSKNSINVKYHITSPQSFWDMKEDQLKRLADEAGKDYKEQDLIDYQKSYLRKIAKVLSGDKNAGKFWHTVDTVFVDGTSLKEQGWTIKPIDQNIKDFADAQIKIGEVADRSASAGVGVHSAIGGTGKDGNSDSGSEQLYALQNYMMTGIDIPEMIVTKAVNYAIKANFPKKKLKLGFYHDQPQREQDKSERDRLKNQKPS
ncbi:hypothetical protein J0871_16995 [Salegentibacter sp. BDJ18]|uniref:hypothetical protein n=1 Tax=Salegentibacter sp. BDJ18 TaxID=2816376 RepID=UPI001AAE893B|nr:hypothetical protein [Salegentibacter sp. BDJ18]MBO2546116.1 hypothetical protein [Salegentibacter sp. BDJ18]